MCNARNFLLFVSTLQLIAIIERQIFDFLGYQWACIAANLLHTLSVIIGAFGAYQSKRSYLYGYSICNVLWIAWNAFVICLYLDVGTLRKEDDILSFGTGIISWWEANGPGCKPVFNLNDKNEFFDPKKPPRPERVDGCYLDYWLVETAHSAIQVTLSVLGISATALFLRYFIDYEDDVKSLGGRSTLRSTKSRAPVYSVQCSPQVPRESSPNPDVELGSMDPGPMTPRRVKRRSVRSNRSSGRKKHRYVNPVTKLIDQGLDSSTSTDSNAFVRGYSAYPVSNPNGIPSLPRRSVGHNNPGYQSSRPSSVYSVSNIEVEPRPPSAHSSYSNWHGQRAGVSSTFLTNANVPSTSAYSKQYSAYNGFGPGRPAFGNREQAESAI